MANNSPFDLAPISRRQKLLPQSEKPSARSFCVETLGEPPFVVSLPPHLVAFLTRLAAAMPDGLKGGDPRTVHAMSELRAAGVPIVSHRAPRTDGRQGWIAVYRLAGAVEAVHG